MKQPLYNLAEPTRPVGDFRPPDASGRRFPSTRRVWFANFRTGLLPVLSTAAWQESSRLELHRPKNLRLHPRSRHLPRIPWALAFQRRINFHGSSFLEGAEVYKNDFTNCFRIRNTLNTCATTLRRDRVTEAVLLLIFAYAIWMIYA